MKMRIINTRFFIGLFFISVFSSCMPEEDLPLRKTGEVTDYFIECYCQPGKNITLSASQVTSITDKIKYNPPPEMHVSVDAGEKIKLYYVSDTPNENEAFCNYLSIDEMNDNQQDTLYLNITTSTKKNITAKTTVPESISIFSYDLSNNNATISFYSSRKKEQNYYIYAVEIVKGSSIIEKSVAYIDYSRYHSENLVEKSIENLSLGVAETVVLTLKRITKENYDYQISLNGASSAIQGSITNPIPLKGNLSGALGIFTCYTEDRKVIVL